MICHKTQTNKQKYKTEIIKNLIYGAFYISSKTIFYKELTNIKQTLVNNNFPNKLVDQQIKPFEKQVKLIIYHTKFKTSNLIVKNKTNSAKIHLNQTNVVYKFMCPFQECLPKNKNNSYIG